MAVPEIFYIKGALADGCLTKGWMIKFTQKSRLWLSDSILPLIVKVFDRKLTQHQIFYEPITKVWYIAFRDKKIWKTLKELPVPTTSQTRQEQTFYIQAFWDADGGCPRFPDKDKKLYIDFTQKEKARLVELKELLEPTFKIKCGDIRISEKKDDRTIWRFAITGKEGMLKFIELIGSSHPEKKLRLEKMKELLVN